VFTTNNLAKFDSTQHIRCPTGQHCITTKIK